MDTKHIHCMLEKIAEYGKQMMEEAVGAGNVNLEDAGKIVDMVKDLACAEKDALIAKEMRKAHEEDESEEKYFLKMLKEEKQDEYKKMKEEYGEDEGERRFYDNYRYANGRFAPKGSGTYRPRSSVRRGRRGYEEMMMPMDYMMPEIYNPEMMRDMDRMDGRMYYSGGGTSGGNSGGSRGGNNGGSSSGGMSGGSMGGSSRGYSEGYDDGEQNGYRRGYEEGERRGRRSGGNSQSRYDRARRGYEEAKMSNDNSPESKKKAMESLDKYMKELTDDMTELVGDMDSSEKAMLKSKLSTLAQKIQ